MSAWVERAWKLALGRAPSEEEKKDSLDLIGLLAQQDATQMPEAPEALRPLPASEAAALTKFCLTLFNMNEFLYID